MISYPAQFCERKSSTFPESIAHWPRNSNAQKEAFALKTPEVISRLFRLPEVFITLQSPLSETFTGRNFNTRN